MHNENTIEHIHQLIEDIQAQLLRLQQEVSALGDIDEQRPARAKAEEVGSIESDHRETIVEGVFDGQNMVGPDGKVYTVPANYASKSKLVEGDIMKLTIASDGTFIYKQIGPVQRSRLLGTLVYDDSTATFRAVTDNGRSFRLLTASVTYFKGKAGDKVVMMVPHSMQSRWAAVEHIMESEDDVPEDMIFDQELLLGSASGELSSGFDMELPNPDAEDDAEEDSEDNHHS